MFVKIGDMYINLKCVEGIAFHKGKAEFYMVSGEFFHINATEAEVMAALKGEGELDCSKSF